MCVSVCVSILWACPLPHLTALEPCGQQARLATSEHNLSAFSKGQKYVIGIYLSVPDELAEYEGSAMVSFGVPFPEGAVPVETLFTLLLGEEPLKDVSFEITSLWPRSENSIRWLLVQALLPVRQAQAPRAACADKNLRLMACSDTGRKAMFHGLVFPEQSKAVENDQMRRLVMEGGLGYFILTDGQNNKYKSTDSIDSIRAEKDNSFITVLRMEGTYRDGEKTVARYITRYEHYKKVPFYRVYHTMIWEAGEDDRIANLAYCPASRIKTDSDVEIGINEKRYRFTDSFSVVQDGSNQIRNFEGPGHIDGWIEFPAEDGSTIVTVRWPWQQYPLGFSADGERIFVNLYCPAEPRRLSAFEEAAVQAVRDFTNSNWDIQKEKGPGRTRLDAKGIAKTYELLIFRGNNIPEPKICNALCNTPIYAYPDPVFAVQAGLPFPQGPFNPEANAKIEAAIKAVFKWITREESKDGDFGTWNYGDVQYDFRAKFAGSPPYRYWMNHGTGWATVPWALWLRSGDREYIEHGIRNCRHLMDVDINHVRRYSTDRKAKKPGGMGMYQPIHGGWSVNKDLNKTDDSEYLQYAFYITGYERAWEVNLLRKNTFLRFDHDEFLKVYENDSKQANREMYRNLAEAMLLYESTLDEQIKQIGERYLRVTAQRPDGSFPGYINAFWLSWPLNYAYRALPEYRQRILSAMTAWLSYRGNTFVAGNQFRQEGPMSAWTAYTLAVSGSKHDLKHAALSMNSMASSVYSQPDIWRGISGMPSFFAASGLRDWLTILRAGQEGIAEIPDGFLDVPFFHGRFPLSSQLQNDGWGGRHVAYLLDEDDMSVVASCVFRLVGISTQRLSAGKLSARVNMYDPSGRLISSTEKLISHGESVISTNIKPDGLTGAYKFEMLTERLPVPVFIGTDLARRMVHMSHNGQLCCLVPSGAGTVWGRTIGGKPAEYTYSSHDYAPRKVIFDRDGNELAHSVIAGTSKKGMPLETDVCYDSPEEELVQILVVNNNWHIVLSLKGFQDYFCSKQSHWFHPEEYAHAQEKMNIIR
jgi:hypothetical protein